MKRQVQLTDFGKKVKIKLIELNMTQVELADRLGTTKQYLGKILYGERRGDKYINQIIRVLGLEEAA